MSKQSFQLISIAVSAVNFAPGRRGFQDKPYSIWAQYKPLEALKGVEFIWAPLGHYATHGEAVQALSDFLADFQVQDLSHLEDPG